MLRPPVFGKAVPSAPVCHPVEGCCDVDNVLSSAWSTMDGSELALLVVNWGDAPQEVDVWATEQPSLKLRQTLPPRSTQIVVQPANSVASIALQTIKADDQTPIDGQVPREGGRRYEREKRQYAIGKKAEDRGKKEDGRWKREEIRVYQIREKG